MDKNTMILGKNQYYSLDCYKTQLNNNVLVVGTSGAGKTRSIVTPNLLQATGSYVVSDPKGTLYTKYKSRLEKEGYVVKKLDFTEPDNSAHYNFFRYIRNTQDIVKIAHMLIYQKKNGGHSDPFWDEAAQLLIQAMIAYLREATPQKDHNLSSIQKLVSLCQLEGDMDYGKTPLDEMIMEHGKKNPESYAVSAYTKFRVAASKTLRSILITINARLGSYDTPELGIMMKNDDIDITSIGQQKNALFVVVSDTDRSLDGLVNIFFSQAMNELCRYADKECEDGCLPIPVRFILDDFATNCKIEEFPRMIASIRSRGMSTMLLIQSEAQLKEGYGADDKTIIGNCDTYVYLGGNDVDTAKSVAERCDVPLRKILNMPVGTNWIFRRGQEPVNGVNFNLEELLSKERNKKNKNEKMLSEIDNRAISA